jgi:hypothetical protein
MTRATTPTSKLLCAAFAMLSFSSTEPLRAEPNPAPTQSTTPTPGDAAREHFKAGVRHLQDPDGARYEDAYREFRAAYAASPNPKILGNIGFCAMKLERDGEAVDAYTRYLAEVSDIDPEEREQIPKDLQTMRSGLVRVTVTIKGSSGPVSVVDTRTPVTGAPVVNAYGPVEKEMVIGLRPGRHTLRAKSQSGEESSWELDATPGSKVSHVFDLTPAPKTKGPTGGGYVRMEEPPSRAVPWVVTVTGGALLVSSAVTGLVAMDKLSRLESRCPNDTCPAGSGLESERASIKRMTRVTDILLVGGAVVTTTGVVWLLLSGGSHPPSDAKDTALARPDLSCSTVGCAFTFTGRF